VEDPCAQEVLAEDGNWKNTAILEMENGLTKIRSQQQNR
jgi:hypothetical protein